MKKALSFLMVAAIILSASAFRFRSNNPGAENTPTMDVSYDSQDLDSMLTAITSLVETAAGTIAEKATALQDEMGDSYDVYILNKTSVESFYSSSIETADSLYATLLAVAVDYFKCVALQGLDDFETWNDALEDFYDAWNDGMEDFYDAWNDTFEEVYDTCDGIIDSVSGQIEYSVYSEEWSDMYDTYSDAWSDMYDEYSDAWSDIYESYSDIWSGFYGEETDVDAILRLNEDIGPITIDPAALITSYTNTEDIENAVSQSVEDSLSSLNTEFESLSEEIDTYQKYIENADSIKTFYDNTNNASASICATMYVYCLDFADVILASGKDKSDMYDDLDVIYDCIYDDAADDIYDGIYDGLLDDLYDAFYDGALDDKDDDTPYEEWSGARSDEYDLWSDTRSACYDHWSDMRSDVYGFWSDLRSDVYRGDMEKAKETVEEFRNDLISMGYMTAEVQAP